MKVTIQPQKVKVSINQTNMGVNINNQIAREVISLDPYEGEYVVTPTNEEQTLFTKDLRMLGNVVINKIPENYGLITWNGSFLMIS